MSAQALRELVHRDVRKKKDEYMAALVERSEDTLDQMRLSQGIIQGLDLALDVMDEAYRKIGE